MFAGNFAPAGWAFCSGQLLSVIQNETLFFLIGTTYGGDGKSTFALPDLRGRIPIHFGGNFTLAETGGAERVTLTVNQLPSHSHAMQATNDIPTQPGPADNLTGQAAAKFYRGGNSTASLAVGAVGATGGSQPHDNLQPYLCVSFIISLFGIFPSQT
jgi:microcystin-dependent protein